MDFRVMTYIVTVADERSVTEAAKRLYITQPSLSYVLRKAEDELGVKLFDRRSSPIKLTYAGERYVDTARKMLKMRDNMLRELNDISHGSNGRINIGMPTERAGYMLPRVVGLFHEKYPHVQIHLQESRSEDIVNNLMKDKIAFAVLPGSREDFPAGVVTELLYREHLYLIGSPQMITEEMFTGDAPDARDGLRTVDLHKVKSLPFFLLPKGQIHRRYTDAILRRADFFPREVMEVSSEISAAQLADAGMGIAIVPERCIAALGGMEHCHAFHFSDRTDSWEINVVYKRDTYLDQAEWTLIDTLRKVFGSRESRGMAGTGNAGGEEV